MNQMPEVKQKQTTAIVIGKESVGKSQLITSLTGKNSYSSNFRGTTVTCDMYQCENIIFIDTPGLVMKSDSENVRLTLGALAENDIVLLVVSAAHINEDLEDLIPLVKDKKGAIVITFWDKVKDNKVAVEYLNSLSKKNNIQIIALDARSLNEEITNTLNNALNNPVPFLELNIPKAINWQSLPEKSVFDIPVVGKIVALLILFLPAWLAVKYSNKLADWCYVDISNLIQPLLKQVNEWPSPLNFIFGGSYGVISMGPFLLLYALPTVIVFSLILAIFKTTGLIDRVTVTLNHMLRPLGLTGRDLVRVIMGFGCKVPAVINTRSCSASTRKQTICAIGFGSACSYQLPATLAVFSMAKMQYLGFIYLLTLTAFTVIYLRLIAPKAFRNVNNTMFLDRRNYLQWPHLPSVWREIWSVLKSFLLQALPVFLVICTIAAVFEWMNLMKLLSYPLSYIMKVFNLPGEVSLSIILGSVRKDGIMILGQGGILSQMSNVQVLTAVFLSGTLLPCLVTLMTIGRETKTAFVMKLIGIQTIAAILFSLIIAWVGKIIIGLI